MSLRRTVRYAAIAAVLVISGLARNASATPITLINATTQVDVYGGEANDGLIPYGGFFRFTDLVSGEETTWSIDPVIIGPGPSPAVYVLSDGSAGGFGSPADIGGGTIRSTASIPGVMDVQADTSLIGTVAQTTFSFTPTGPALIGYRFLFYAENDLFDFADDTAAFTGSIAGGDLTLYQYDTLLGGLTVNLRSGSTTAATLSGFGSGIWTGWGDALSLGDLSSLSADGSTFVTGPGDLGIALLYSLDLAGPASITVDYGTQAAPPPTVPEPGTMTMIGLGLVGIVRSRRAARLWPILQRGPN